MREGKADMFCGMNTSHTPFRHDHVYRYGRNWRKIVQKVGTRSVAQVSLPSTRRGASRRGWKIGFGIACQRKSHLLESISD